MLAVAQDTLPGGDFAQIAYHFATLGSTAIDLRVHFGNMADSDGMSREDRRPSKQGGEGHQPRPRLALRHPDGQFRTRRLAATAVT
jgi:hypothetical protein